MSLGGVLGFKNVGLRCFMINIGLEERMWLCKYDGMGSKWRAIYVLRGKRLGRHKG